MSDLANLIFHNAKTCISSKFGYRKVINTSAGATSPFHSGVDYATYGVKLPQYAIENGTILTAGRASDGANYVWVSYPRLGVKMMHYHLDSIKVTAGQSVSKNTIIGYTGRTGKATGIHLHLGLKLLSGGGFIDPEEWFLTKYTKPNVETPKPDATKKVVAKDVAKSFDKSIAGTYKVTASALNVRYGAGTKKSVMVTIPKNTTVKCYGYYTKADGVKWFYIQFEYKGVNYTGFASSKYLKR